MLIVCAGRSRSGSTLLYNLVRLTMIEIYGKENVYGRGINFYRKGRQKKYNIAKLHDTSDSYFYINADYVFSCRRNQRDQKESIKRVRHLNRNQNLSEEDLDRLVQSDFLRYKKWANHKNFITTFDYHLLVNKKDQVIRKICKALRIKVSTDQITNIINEVNRIKPPKVGEKRNPETALIWNHISGGRK
jgi:hypothetical protein